MFANLGSRKVALSATAVFVAMLVFLASLPARAQGQNPLMEPTPTPVGAGPMIQSFQQQSAPAGDLGRGIDSTTFTAYYYDTSDLLDPILPQAYTEPIDFELPCFGEPYPYNLCKLNPILTEGGNYSIRWTGILLVPEDGEYTLAVPFPDDGVRVYIDNAEIVDSGWRYPTPDVNPSPQPLTLSEGLHDLVIEYEQRVPYAAALHFRWSGPGFADEVVPLTNAGLGKLSNIEFTQATQELQTIQQLSDDLVSDGEPPVAIVAGKPAAVRLYFGYVSTTASISVEFSIPGVTTQSRQVTLPPGCSPTDQRRGMNGCASVDFYFRPPEGAWTASISTTSLDGQEIESHEFSFVSRSTTPPTIVSVGVCDLKGPFESYCEEGSKFFDYVNYLLSGLPTSSLNVGVPTAKLRILEVPGKDWWLDLMLQMHSLWVSQGLPDYYYHAMVPSEAPLAGVPSGFSIGRSAATRIHGSDAFTSFIFAHETAHLFGRHHTNTDLPPGRHCILPDLPRDNDWEGDNGIKQVGFDIGSAPNSIRDLDNMDWMSYCPTAPWWVSPYTYRGMMDYLLDPSPPLSEPVGVGLFWQVSGLFDTSGELEAVSPVFFHGGEGPLGSGSGDYRIEVLGSAGQVLFVRFFDPVEGGTYTSGEGIDAFVFSEMVRQQPGATSLRILDGTGSSVMQIDLTGELPLPLITTELPEGQPVVGEHLLEWEVYDPDSDEHTYRLTYTADGETIHVLTWDTMETNLLVDFDELPGCAEGDCVIRLFVSDGANSEVDYAAYFEVPRKPPSVEITNPAPGSVFRSGTTVWLQASARDPDEGYLDGPSMVWYSDKDRSLGSGQQLPITELSEGTHTIRLEATDSDGNVAADEMAIHIDGTMPLVTLEVEEAVPPTTCILAAMDASDPSEGSGLASFEFSLDRGATWTPVPSGEMPYEFFIPGEGLIHLVARAIDAAGNVSAADQLVYIDQACNLANSPPIANAGGPYESTEGATITLDGSLSTDPEGGSLEYRWDYEGDGTFDTEFSSDPSATATYDDDFVGVTVIEVRDSGGLVAESTGDVLVENVPPAVVAGGDMELYLSEPAEFSGSFTDPGNLDTHEIQWDFGDGHTTSGTLSTSHTYDDSGTYQVVLTVTDNDGGVGSDELLVTVTDPSGFSLGDFVILGLEGVYLKQNSIVISGDVGANLSSSGPYLAGTHEVTVGIGADVSGTGSFVYGDSIKLKNNSTVYSVAYNELDNNGSVIDEETTPIDLPLISTLPEVPPFSAGTEVVEVEAESQTTLAPGEYGVLLARAGSSVRFSGGIYTFYEWDIRDNVMLYFEEPTEVFIEGKLMVDQDTYVGPSPEALDLDASDITFFITGQNGNNGNIGATPKAAQFGIGSTIVANAYAPYGTIWIRQNSSATGAFIAKWVTLGIGASIELESAW